MNRITILMPTEMVCHLLGTVLLFKIQMRQSVQKVLLIQSIAWVLLAKLPSTRKQQGIKWELCKNNLLCLLSFCLTVGYGCF